MCKMCSLIKCVHNVKPIIYLDFQFISMAFFAIAKVTKTFEDSGLVQPRTKDMAWEILSQIDELVDTAIWHVYHKCLWY